MILITGGSGLLGTELHLLLPKALVPSKSELDICDKEKVLKYFSDNKITTVIHCAGYMPPAKINENPGDALMVNIAGTCFLVHACIRNNAKIIYISTDYVFKGDKGNYKEDDELLPVNKYGWSKLGGECAVKMYDNSLVIRTSFGAIEFPYDTAFIDQWTSKESVTVVAKKIINVLDMTGVIHIGGKRRSLFDYATETSPNKKIKTAMMPTTGYMRPRDTSLDTSKYSSTVPARYTPPGQGHSGSASTP